MKKLTPPEYQEKNELTTISVTQGECIERLRLEPTGSFDLTFTSPPYEDARLYDVGFKIRGNEWVDWCFERFVECLRVTNGLVAFVVNGRTRAGKYSLTPERLAIRLAEAGYTVPRPASFQRYGIPDGGNWLRPINETIVCASRVWPLPYTNFKSGPPPKYKRGGNFSNRTKNGSRVSGRKYPSVKRTWRTNVFAGNVGKGHMGSDLAHENEAPFPQWLAEAWLEIFCPPGGHVLDPFCGSGTTLAAAKKLGMSATGIDLRGSQAGLSIRRLSE